MFSKRLFALSLALMMALCLLPATALTEAQEDDIHVSLLFPQNSGLRPAMDTTVVWDYIHEHTGIRFDLSVIQGREQVELMFASRDYPDMMANVGASATQLLFAAEAGDLVELGPMLEERSSAWMKFFDENPMIYNMELIDGKLYTLPYVMQNPYDRELRDQWLYIYPWLEELNLEVPTTTEAFKEALMAIKEAAGTGTIPENVIPFYFLYDSYVGGQFDILGAFGVVCTTAEYLAVDPDGVVVCNAVNPDIIPALEYMQELYALGLIPAECFTDDWSSYLSKISSDPPMVFSYFSFANRLPRATYPMGVPDSETGKTPYMRPQAYIANPARATAVFSNTEHAERIVDFFDWATRDENVMTMVYGNEGVVWDYTEDGKFMLNFWESSPDLMNEHAESVGFNNSWFAMMPRDLFAERTHFPEVDIVGTREWGIANIYKDQLPEWNAVYLGGTLDVDSTTMMSQYQGDLNNYRKQTIADWIINGTDISAQWDGYVQEMERLGLEDWLALKQQAYDMIAQ